MFKAEYLAAIDAERCTAAAASGLSVGQLFHMVNALSAVKMLWLRRLPSGL